jgi:MFS family permease
MKDKVAQFSKNTFSSLKVRNYRLYFIGQSISQSGTWMETVGLGWLVLKLTGSGTALGLIIALRFLPILFLAPWGGVLADRMPKRKLLLATQAALGIFALALGILVAGGWIQLWMVSLLALCFGIATAIDNPTRQTFVMEMVGKDDLSNAITLNSMLMNLARTVGPAIAGALIATTGLASCFLVNALSYGAVLIALWMMRTDELHSTPLVARAKGQMMEGFRYVRSNPKLRNTLLMLAIIGTLSYEFIVSLPLLAEFTFHGDAASYAALTSALGIGSVIGGIGAANRKKTSPKLLLWGALLFGGSILIAAAMPTLALATFAIALVGVCSINFQTMGNVLIQLESTPEMRGRVMAFWTMAFMGSTPIGGPIIGAIGEHIGPRWGLATGGAAAIVAAWFGAVTMLEKRGNRVTR